MRKLGILLAAVSVFSLAGCRSKDASGTAATPGSTEAGGYAGALAEPPKDGYELSQADIERNIEAGASTDSKEKPPELTPEEKARADKAAKEAAESAAKAEKEARAKGGETPPDPSATNVPRDTSGDAKYKSSAKPVAALQTKYGVIYLEFWPDKAPRTVNSITKLVKDKFYDGIVIHRVEPGFVVQFGDPLTKRYGANGPDVGTGGPGFTIPDEFSDTLKHKRGILSMANTGRPNSQGSQIFILLGDSPFLDGKYSIFGQVLGNGMALVDKMRKGDIILHAWMVADPAAAK